MGPSLLSMFSFESNPRFVSIFIFGLVVIVLYAKDKFNMPTYDREAMGPFAHLSPQAMTMDSRYRRGRAIYIALLLMLYLVICILGPTTFPNFDIFKAAGQFGAPQLGPQLTADGKPMASEFWPIAAATFLISTAAASDNSVIGRVELWIRQYAHKEAYIPTAVSNLAFSLKQLAISQWLTKNPYLTDEQKRARQRALANLIGEDVLAELIDKPDDDTELHAWARANILFYTLSQIFHKNQDLTSTHLDYLTDLPENVQIFRQIEAEQQKLRKQFEALRAARANGDVEAADKFVSEVRRFARDVSLTIAVLLSRTAKNSSDLRDRLDPLGFEGVQLPEQLDHFGYVAAVYASIILGMVVSAVLLYLALSTPWLVSDGVRAQGDSAPYELRDYFPGLATIFTGCLAYLIAFKMADYLRDSSLDAADWSEGIGSYVYVVTLAAFASAIITIFTFALFFSFVLGGITAVWSDVAGLLQQWAFQFMVAAFVAAFTLIYMRQAARSLPSDRRLWSVMRNPTPYIHGLLVALLVGGMSYIISEYSRGLIVKNVRIITASLDDGLRVNRDCLALKFAAAGPAAGGAPNARCHPQPGEPARTALASGGPAIGNERVPGPPDPPAVKRLDPGPDLQRAQELVKLEQSASDLYFIVNYQSRAYGDPSKHGSLLGSAGTAAAAQDAPARSDATQTNEDANGDRVSLLNKQIDMVRSLCIDFNKIDVPPAEGKWNARTREGVALPPPTKVFKRAATCEPDRGLTSVSDDESPLRTLATTLGDLHDTLVSLSYVSDDPKHFTSLIFPMTTAFWIGSLFGIGCLYMRGWWLAEGVEDAPGRRLQEKLIEKYGPDIDIDRFLAQPLRKLGKITALEALRYEDYRSKLHRLIQRDQLPEFTALRRKSGEAGQEAKAESGPQAAAATI